MSLSRPLVLAACALLAAAPTADAQNLALNQPTTASSVFQGFAPEEAVNGNTSFLVGVQNGFHSLTTPNPWWYVDLGDNYDLTEVRFFNRTDGSFEQRIRGAELGLFAGIPYQVGSPAAVESWIFPADFSAGSATFTSTSSAVGRYVGIIIPTTGADTRTLNFAELEVYGARAVAPPPPPTAVPEPPTYLLLASGLLAIGAVARRRASV